VEDRILTLKELQDYLRLSQKTVLKLLGSGEIKAKKVGNKWRILKSTVDDYLKKFDN
jgi:excisionase family DNA binding protein